MSDEISYKVLLSNSFAETIQLVREALSAEGFGVLTEIDVQTTLKKKLGKDFRPYLILGACNPLFAHQALLTEPEVGIMLPCNVTLDQQEEGVLVCFANPAAMLTIGDFGTNHQLREVAESVNERILRVVETLR
jgi:uncharacterized protein (DUF302 family)